MCSMRSSAVSIEPNIIVAVVGISSSCASRMTPSHSSGLTLRAEIRLRTRSTRISAPAPGSDFMPAALRRTSTSRTRHVLDLGESRRLRRPRASGCPPAETRARRALESASNHSSAELGVDAALDHDLRRALIGCVFHALEHLVVRHGVAFFVMLGPEERAERAVHVADVGVVDRRIDHVGDDVASDRAASGARARRRRDRANRPR